MPRTRQELEALPGVGRKTAGVVLIHLGAEPAFPVDTHVHRVTTRLGLVPPKATAVKAQALLEEFGVTERGLPRVISACYRALDLITFLTTGEDETRAWEVRRGARAPEAAGVIHSDLERGFIRAEVIGYEQLVADGSMEAAKSHGHLRMEGKDYVVQEGDILHVRFAV